MAQLESLIGTHSRKPWSKFVGPENQHLVSPEGMDLLVGPDGTNFSAPHLIRYAAFCVLLAGQDAALRPRDADNQ